MRKNHLEFNNINIPESWEIIEIYNGNRKITNQELIGHLYYGCHNIIKVHVSIPKEYFTKICNWGIVYAHESCKLLTNEKICAYSDNIHDKDTIYINRSMWHKIGYNMGISFSYTKTCDQDYDNDFIIVPRNIKISKYSLSSTIDSISNIEFAKINDNFYSGVVSLKSRGCYYGMECLSRFIRKIGIEYSWIEEYIKADDNEAREMEALYKSGKYVMVGDRTERSEYQPEYCLCKYHPRALEYGIELLGTESIRTISQNIAYILDNGYSPLSYNYYEIFSHLRGWSSMYVYATTAMESLDAINYDMSLSSKLAISDYMYYYHVLIAIYPQEAKKIVHINCKYVECMCQILDMYKGTYFDYEDLKISAYNSMYYYNRGAKYRDKPQPSKTLAKLKFMFKEKYGRVPNIIMDILWYHLLFKIPMSDLVDKFDVKFVKRYINKVKPRFLVKVMYMVRDKNMREYVINRYDIFFDFNSHNIDSRIYVSKRKVSKSNIFTLLDNWNTVEPIKDLPIKDILKEVIKNTSSIEMKRIEKKYKDEGFVFKDCVFNLKFDKYTEVINGHNMKAFILEPGDTRMATLGHYTDCCQRLNRAGESAMMYGLVADNAGFWALSDDDNIIAQAEIWEDSNNNNNLMFDNIEINNRYFKDHRGIVVYMINKWLEISKYKNIQMGLGYNEISNYGVDSHNIKVEEKDLKSTLKSTVSVFRKFHQKYVGFDAYTDTSRWNWIKYNGEVVFGAI